MQYIENTTVRVRVSYYSGLKLFSTLYLPQIINTELIINKKILHGQKTIIFSEWWPISPSHIQISIQSIILAGQGHFYKDKAHCMHAIKEKTNM